MHGSGNAVEQRRISCVRVSFMMLRDIILSSQYTCLCIVASLLHGNFKMSEEARLAQNACRRARANGKDADDEDDDSPIGSPNRQSTRRHGGARGRVERVGGSLE